MRSLARSTAVIAAIACSAILSTLLPTTAVAATASWSLQPESFDFGALTPNEAAPEPAHLKLVNTGAAWLTPALVALGSEGEFSLAYDGCRGPLAPGGSCGIEVTFKPRSSGPKEATLEVFESNGTAPPAVARLSGAGVAPTVTIDPTSIDFDTVQAGIRPPQQRTVTVTNHGPGELSIASVEFLTDEAWTIPGPIRWIWTSSRSCSSHFSLPPAGSCTVTFEFGSSDPVSAAGELRITDDALDSPQVIHVSGTVAPAPAYLPPPPYVQAPVATLSGHPGKRTKSRIATFTFSGNEDTRRFECRLDNGAWRHCHSPTQYRSLKPGKHRFWVRPIGTFPTTILGPALNYHWRIIGPPAKKRAHSGRHR